MRSNESVHLNELFEQTGFLGDTKDGNKTETHRENWSALPIHQRKYVI